MNFVISTATLKNIEFSNYIPALNQETEIPIKDIFCQNLRKGTNLILLLSKVARSSSVNLPLLTLGLALSLYFGGARLFRGLDRWMRALLLRLSGGGGAVYF